MIYFDKNNFSASGIYSIFPVPNQPLSPPLCFFLFFRIWIDPPSQPTDRRHTMEKDDDTVAVDGGGRRAVANSGWGEGTTSGLAAGR
jgi:hypothetical protein